MNSSGPGAAAGEEKQLKVLFVDDEPDFEGLIRQRYRRLIRSGDIAIEFARDGRQALEKVTQDQGIAIVMSDINMPAMDGLELLAEIHRIGCETPVVMISAYGDMDNIRTAMNRGAFDFLLKPIDFEDLETTRAKAMEHFLALREKRRLESEKQRLEEQIRFTRETFGRYVSDSLVERLLEGPEGRQLGGERREVSVLMADLRGFSSLAERLPAEDTLTILNNHFEIMIDVIIKHGGLIDELLGDGILVIFGAPLPQHDHALRATACAVAMQQAMRAVNQENARRGLPQVEMGIGINSGEVVVGNIGSRKRTKFGVVGTNVNLAARIESRTIGGQILISQETYRRCRSDIEVAVNSEFIAKGFQDPIKTYSLKAVGGEFDYRLEERPVDLLELREAVPLCFAVLSNADDQSYSPGELLRLSDRSAEIRTESVPFDDFQAPLRLRILDADGEIESDELYGKAVARTSGNTFVVYFTSVPPSVAEMISALLKRSATG